MCIRDRYYYEDEVKISADGIVLCKDSLDELLRTVEQNNHVEIRNAVATFYDETVSYTHLDVYKRQHEG